MPWYASAASASAASAVSNPRPNGRVRRRPWGLATKKGWLRGRRGGGRFALEQAFPWPETASHPLSTFCQLTAPAAFVTDSSRSERFCQHPPLACLTAPDTVLLAPSPSNASLAGGKGGGGAVNRPPGAKVPSNGAWEVGNGSGEHGLLDLRRMLTTGPRVSYVLYPAPFSGRSSVLKPVWGMPTDADLCRPHGEGVPVGAWTLSPDRAYAHGEQPFLCLHSGLPFFCLGGGQWFCVLTAVESKCSEFAGEFKYSRKKARTDYF